MKDGDGVGAGVGAVEQLGLDLAREMRLRWKGGERPAAEEFLSRQPDLGQCPEAVVEVIYEEYCLRVDAGEHGAEQDLLTRFPQWAGPLRVMLDCHRRLIEAGRDSPRFPEVGECVAGFRLAEELFRGPRSRVFLATQSDLSDRAVVLKVTSLDGAEHLSLARLQHTNIVPLFSAAADPARNVRVLCMPYFGRTTLGALLESLANVPPGARTGRDAVDLIRAPRDRDGPPQSLPRKAGSTGTTEAIAAMSFAGAMAWVAACLADALQFAHDRGLVHLDLKPSNVLISSDFQPMLLDFHLAREPVGSQSGDVDGLGGTPHYMPPEQRAAMQAARGGHPVEEPIDARADVYALGAMLYESLGGTLPHGPGSPALDRLNPQVSPGLSDVVSKCLKARPRDRYGDAASLAADLRRYLADQPLVGVANRSVVERWRKWRRRDPGRLRAAAMAFLLAGAAAVLAGGAWSNARDRGRQAAEALAEGQRLMDAGRYDDAVRTFDRGLAIAPGAHSARDLYRRGRAGRDAAVRAQLADRLHRLADEVRVLYGAEAPAGRLDSLAAQCLTAWQKRRLMLGSLGPATPFDAAGDLRDIALFAATRCGEAGACADLLDEVQTEFGPSAVINQERRVRALPRALAAAPAPRTAWEHYALGRSLMAAGDLSQAEAELEAAVALDPAGRWANFYLGVCAYKSGRFADAIAAFNVCVGAAPDFAGCYYNRGLAQAALGRGEPALRDCSRALQIDPGHCDALLSRGRLHYQRGDLADAATDFRAALARGADPAGVHYNLALVHAANDDPVAALDDVRQTLELDPADEQARRLYDALAR